MSDSSCIFYLSFIRHSIWCTYRLDYVFYCTAFVLLLLLRTNRPQNLWFLLANIKMCATKFPVSFRFFNNNNFLAFLLSSLCIVWVCVCAFLLFRGNRVAMWCEPNLSDGHRNKIWKRFSSSSHSATINIKINVGNLNKLIFIWKCFERCVCRCGEARKSDAAVAPVAASPKSMQTNKIRRRGACYQTQTELKLAQFRVLSGTVQPIHTNTNRKMYFQVWNRYVRRRAFDFNTL